MNRIINGYHIFKRAVNTLQDLQSSEYYLNSAHMDRIISYVFALIIYAPTSYVECSKVTSNITLIDPYVSATMGMYDELGKLLVLYSESAKHEKTGDICDIEIQKFLLGDFNQRLVNMANIGMPESLKKLHEKVKILSDQISS